jgi:hypothetical protein
MAKAQKDPEIIELARGLQNTPWCDEYEKMISGMLYFFFQSAPKPSSLLIPAN